MAKKSKKIEKISKKPPATGASVSSYPQPPTPKAEDYLTAYKGYVFTAISAIAHEVASIDLHLYKVKQTNRGAETEEVYEHPAKSLLHTANNFMTSYDLYEATQTYQELVGEAFWVLLREGGEGEQFGMPKEIYVLRPDWMKIVPSKDDFIKEYEYQPSGNIAEKITIPRECIIHYKSFNPTSPYRGKGSVQAGAMSIDIHTFMNDWNRNLFFNNAMPSAVFTTDKKFNKPVIDRFMEQWQSTYGGRNNAHKVAFLSGGFKLDKLSQSAKDLDFANQLAMMRDDILAVFKVPKTVLGLTDDVNKANAEATTRAFMERVITPRLRKFVGQLNEFYLPMFPDSDNMFFDFTDPAPEDVEIKLGTYDNALTHGWMTINEVRAMENLEPLEGGDEVGVADEDGKNKTLKAVQHGKLKKVKHNKPNSLLRKKHMMLVPPIKMDELERKKIKSEIQGDIYNVISKMLKGETEKFDKDPKDSWSKEEREAYWRVFGDRTQTSEDELKAIMRKLWGEEEAEILQGLDNIKYWKKSLRKGKESSAIPSLDDMVKRWVATYIPFIRETVIEEGQGILEFIGVGGNLDMTTESVVEFVRVNGVKLVKEINKTTRAKVARSIADGLAKEESIDQIKKRVQKRYNQFSSTRAETIARTEVIRASNFAAEEAYIQSDVVTEKEWLTSRDERVCPYCNPQDGKRVKIGKPFYKKGDTVTGEDGTKFDVNLLDVDTPPLHPKCRCTLIPVIE